jgi:hypothetical protein
VAKQPFILRERGSGTRLTVERVFRERGLSLNVRMELGSNEAIKQAVAGGLGLGILSLSTLHHDPSLDEVAVLDVEDFPIRRHWYLVWPRDKQLSVVATAFLDFLRGHVDLLAHREPVHVGAVAPNVASYSSGALTFAQSATAPTITIQAYASDGESGTVASDGSITLSGSSDTTFEMDH